MHIAQYSDLTDQTILFESAGYKIIKKLKLKQHIDPKRYHQYPRI